MKNTVADPNISTPTSTQRRPMAAATPSQTRSTPASSGTAHTPDAPSSTASAKRKVSKAASAAAETAKARAANLTSAVESRAEDMVDSALSSVHDSVNSGKQQASGYVGAFGRAFEAASNSLETDGLALPATYVRAAANGLNQAADEVHGFNTSSVTGSVERYVRGNPMLAVAGLALAGFAFANFVGGNNKR